MRTPRYETILSAVARLDADPAEVQATVTGVRSGLMKLSHRPWRTLKHARSAASLTKQIEALPLRLVAGGKKPLGEVLRDLKAATPARLLSGLGPQNFYTTGPFARLGNLPVSASADEPTGVRLRNLFPVFGEESQRRVPVAGLTRRSHTYWMYYSHSWWSALLYSRFSASTRAAVTGWEACDLLDGEYAAAKQACETLVVPPPGDPNQFIIAFLKAAACSYAANAPETPFPAMRIQTIVCSCLVVGSDGSCDPYVSRPGHDPEIDEACNKNSATNTAGPVDATHTEWGGTCLGVTSQHLVDFVPQVFLVEDFC
ncbi:MAG TPA: hypothetical protein VEU62_09460 [Bryobacterales bacterium]|nr:hypothetical protein [Bryobacterales bacterium]